MTEKKTFKKFSFNFFQLTSQIPLHELLISEGKNWKNVEKADSFICSLEKGVRDNGDYIIGTLVYNQTKDLPPKYNIEKKAIEALILEDSESLSYPTSFIFDKQCNILMLEQGRVSLSSFCLFMEKNHNGLQIDTTFVLNPLDLNKVYDWVHLKKLKVKIARVKNGTLYHDKDESVVNLVETAENTNSDELTVILSSKKGNLKKNAIMKLIRRLGIYKNTNEVKEMVLTGRDDDNEGVIQTIDLIENRLKANFTVEKPRNAIEYKLKDKYNEMIELYNFHRPGLLQAYGKTKDASI